MVAAFRDKQKEKKSNKEKGKAVATFIGKKKLRVVRGVVAREKPQRCEQVAVICDRFEIPQTRRVVLEKIFPTKYHPFLSPPIYRQDNCSVIFSLQHSSHTPRDLGAIGATVAHVADRLLGVHLSGLLLLVCVLGEDLGGADAIANIERRGRGDLRVDLSLAVDLEGARAGICREVEGT